MGISDLFIFPILTQIKNYLTNDYFIK